MTIEAHANMKEYFHERLLGALSRLSVSATPETEFYLVELLARQAAAPGGELFDRPLFDRLATALSVVDRDERFRQLRATGDCALVVCGFFADHFEHRGIRRDYVVGMGGRAYRAAGGSVPRPRAEVFEELSDGFGSFASVLDEVRENTVLRTPQDIVRLYDRYRRTKSPALAARLRGAGVFPQLFPDGGTVH